MYLKLVLAIFLLTAPTISAAPQSSLPLGYAQCISTNECSWTNSNGNSHCVCDYCPSSDFSDPYLASFFTGANFQGSELKTYGTYGECIDLPTIWTSQLNSMKSNTKSGFQDICCVFTATQCDVTHAFTPAAASIAQLIGVYKDGVRSIVCSKWNGPSSTCASWVPVDPPNTLYLRDGEGDTLKES
ncbi:hypothetical protein N431DRAFT_499604 [Stipitochalara longipes BDJ]|nr:hypothetical protein N431DRAFT_499604 [Stipitochalara longipes BDJ]